MPAEINGADVRARFAPSPTGYLHVGSARTALFNWIFARSVGGKFVLRIEDTDANRNQQDVIDVIFRELEWLGIDWDEEPVFQSARKDRHREVVSRLLADGRAYMEDAEKNEVAGTEIQNGMAVRYRVPKGRSVSFQDDVRGEVTFQTDDLEDFVIWRSNGSAMFLLANAVDDADMGITHAIRGEDLLNTVPKVTLLLEEMGVPSPRYGHLPLLVGEDRKKLSKRKDDVSLADYRTRGYLPEAMANYLALLGWGPPDDVEIRPMAEIIDLFSLESVNKAPAFFDVKKLQHFNSTYIQAMEPAEFVATATPFITTGDEPWAAEDFDPTLFALVAPEIQQRVRTLSESSALLDWMFVDEVTFQAKPWTKAMVKGKRVPEILDGVIERYQSCDWNPETIGSVVRDVGDELEVRSQAPVRVAITGTNAGIPMWDAVEKLGRDRTVARLQRARDLLASGWAPEPAAEATS